MTLSARVPKHRVLGVLLSTRSASRVFGMPYNTVIRRMYRLGWSLEKAVLTPRGTHGAVARRYRIKI